jgi:nucleolar protein 12
MLPRILRVVRAKAVRKTALASASRSAARPGGKDRVYNPKMPAEQSSLQGRAGKLLGRAGAAQFKKGRGSGTNEMVLGKRGDGKSGIEGIAKTPEKIVFEGYRATSGNKPNLGGKKKKSSKPVNRGAKRASAWKKGGAKRAK